MLGRFHRETIAVPEVLPVRSGRCYWSFAPAGGVRAVAGGATAQEMDGAVPVDVDMTEIKVARELRAWCGVASVCIPVSSGQKSRKEQCESWVRIACHFMTMWGWTRICVRNCP